MFPFILQIYSNDTKPPCRPCLPHGAAGLPADLTNEKTALLHGSFLTGGAPVCGCGKAMQLFYIYKLIKVYHIH